MSADADHGQVDAPQREDGADGEHGHQDEPPPCGDRCSGQLGDADREHNREQDEREGG